MCRALLKNLRQPQAYYKNCIAGFTNRLAEAEASSIAFAATGFTSFALKRSGIHAAEACRWNASSAWFKFNCDVGPDMIQGYSNAERFAARI